MASAIAGNGVDRPPRAIAAEALSDHRAAGGRIVIDQLPRQVGVLPGEADLVAQHLLDALDALLAGRPPPGDHPPPG